MTFDNLVINRRTALKGIGLAALLGTSSVPLGCRGTARNGVETMDLLDLTFDLDDTIRPFALVAPGFEAVDEPRPGAMRSVVRTDQGLAAPFAAIEASVEASQEADVVMGLFSAVGDHVAVVFSPTRGQVGVEVRREGVTHVVAQTAADLQAPFEIAFVICENQVTALADTGKGWRALLTERDKVASLVDLRDAATLSAFVFGYGAAGPVGEVRLRGVRAGPFGMAGLRDPHLVQRPDGTAYVRDGLVYMTFTCAGLGFFQQAHWGVFTLKLDDPTSLQQVAQLYSRRDGLVLGDHAGQIIVDEPNGQFVVLTSSWGDFDFNGVHVRHTVTSDNVLAGIHLLETERLNLPTQVSSWDPAATQIDGRWHVAFVESPSQDPFDFHPALAAGAAGAAYDSGLELVGADTSLRQCEGPILQRVGDRWYLLASDGEARRYPVYDLSVELLGHLDAPYGTNIPHPQIVEGSDGGYVMVTFDGTQYGEEVLGYGGHGDVLILSSRPR